MNEVSEGFRTAFSMLVGLDPQLVEIVALSLQVTLSALAIASVIAFPVGGALALLRFPGRRALAVVFDALMGFPPVVAGLLVYLFLSRGGPGGSLGWLFTPKAMVVAQVVIIAPIIVALSRQVMVDLWEEYEEQLRSLGVSRVRAIFTLLWDGRFRLVTTVLAGFGRAIAEVGAVIIVGGNIAHVTRVMTTAIALETSRGNLALALALGIVLMVLSLLVNGAAALASGAARKAG